MEKKSIFRSFLLVSFQNQFQLLTRCSNVESRMKLPFKYAVIMKITILTEKDLVEIYMFQEDLFQLKSLFS